MKLIITGYKRHGKDTVCEYLRDYGGFTFTSSSWYACNKFLFAALKDKYGYDSVQACFDDRDNHRQEWFEAINAYNTPDLSRLVREIFCENDIYCGLRNRDEFVSAREDGLVDLAIWVDASGRKPPESASSMTLRQEDTDLTIDNNGTLEALYARLDVLILTLREMQAQTPRRDMSPLSPLHGLAPQC